jgi:peptidoglycan/LPS O-acetylase OafA/YrhL
LGVPVASLVSKGPARSPPVLSRHIPALDGIRGLAIIWVVLHNATAQEFVSPRGVFYLLTLFTHTGWIGVQLFFALSGFLITAGLLDSQGAPHYFRDFYAKRALRILPLYYAVLLLVLVVLPRFVTLHAPFSSHPQASLWLFIANWTNSVPYGFGHFWSLAIEEQFYLFWPLVVCWLPPRRLLTACVWIAVGALAVRSAMVAYGADPGTVYENTICRMDALALGGAGACVLRVPSLRDQVSRRLGVIGVATFVLFAAGIPLTHAYAITGSSGETLGYTLLALCSAIFVMSVALSQGRARAGVVSLLAWGPLRSFGKYSYAMYIFHNLLHKLWGEPWLIARFGERPPVQVVFAYGLMILMLSYLLAFCSYHLLEKRFLRLKRFFEPQPPLARGRS